MGCDPDVVRFESAAIPSHLCLLRVGILILPDSTLLHLDRARALLASLDAPPEDRDVAARVVDAYAAAFPHAVTAPLAAADWSASMSVHTLPWLATEVSNMSFNHDIAMVKDPITNLISKGLAARCQTRLAGRVTEKIMYESPDDMARYDAVQATPAEDRRVDDVAFLGRYREMRRMRGIFKSIVMCGMLGNFPHVTGHRLHGAARARCYALFQGDSESVSESSSDAWFQSMLHQAPMVIIWCLREFIVHALLDSPGLLAAVGAFIHFSAFRRITAGAMHAIRVYAQQNLPWDWSSMGGHAHWVMTAPTAQTEVLCRCMHKCKNQRKGETRRAKTACRYQAGHYASEWLYDMTRLVQPFHDDMLVESYHKPDAGILSFLMGRDVRIAAPLVPRPLSDAERAQQDTADALSARMEAEEREEDDVRQLLNDRLGTFVDDRGSLMATARYKAFMGDKQDASAKASERAGQDARASAVVFEFLHPAQFKVLARLADTVAELVDLVPLFDGLGVADPAVIASIVALLHHHRDGTVTKQERMRQIKRLWEREPHAYNLLQIGAELIKLAQRKRSCVVGELSEGSYRAQLAAARTKSLGILQADDQLRVSSFDKTIAKFEAKVRKDPGEWQLPLAQLVQLRSLFEDRIDRMAETYTGVIEESGVCLYVCVICNHVYSNVRESMSHTFYKWGLREAGCDYSTGTLHCMRNCVSFQGRCSDTPLHRVNLLGIRFAWDKKAYQLCSRCGDVFVPDPQLCTDGSGRGLMCCACTEQHWTRLNTDPAFDKATAFVVALDRRCAYCNESKNLDDHTFLYPFDLVLCHSHHSKSTRWHVRQAVAGKTGWRDYGACRDRESTKEFLISLISGKRKERREKQMRRGVASMKRNRQKNRQKKC